MPSQKMRRGRYAEEQVARYLTKLGWKVLRQNFRWKIPSAAPGSRAVEIDILAQKGRQVLLAEVKFRRRADVLAANYEWLSESQRRRLQRAKCYAASRKPHLLFIIALLWVDEYATVHFLENC
jgi:Holliday junction resolvase-like predicted endonuclease